MPDEPGDNEVGSMKEPYQAPQNWFGVRTVYYWHEEQAYEERVTLWRADSLADALDLAEAEAKEYGSSNIEFLNFVQAYATAQDDLQIEPAFEAFSLIRPSKLDPDSYLNAFFDTGTERTQHLQWDGTPRKHDRTPLEEILVDGLDHWNSEGDVISAQSREGLFGHDVDRWMAVGLIAEVIVGEYVVPGDLGDDGFEPWEMSKGDAIARITRDWVENWSTEYPTPGAIAWFDNTPSGNAIGRAVLEREGLVS